MTDKENISDEVSHPSQESNQDKGERFFSPKNFKSGLKSLAFWAYLFWLTSRKVKSYNIMFSRSTTDSQSAIGMAELGTIVGDLIGLTITVYFFGWVFGPNGFLGPNGTLTKSRSWWWKKNDDR